MSFKSYNLKLDWNQDLPKHWFDNSPFKTHFMNSLSTRLTEGERFLSTTMAKFREETKNTEYEEQVKEFIIQEATHKRIHTEYNKWLDSQGYPAKELENLMVDRQRSAEEKFSKETLLYIVVCIEHFTTVFAEFFLTNPELLDQMHPHFRRIWQWHSIEELEHSSIADEIIVWKNHNIFLKRLMMTLVISSVLYNILIGTVILLKTDKQLWKWKTFKDAFLFFCNLKNGFIIKSFFSFFKYIKPNHRPMNYDYTDLIARYEK